MSLDIVTKQLKELVSTYNTDWFLGDLSELMKHIAEDRAQDQLSQLSSPLRQIYFLGGLVMSSNPENGSEIMYDPEKWGKIVAYLNAIEKQYQEIFFPKKDEVVDDKWKRVRRVAMPSFLSYFNQGPLNYEEQVISWIENIYKNLDDIILQRVNLQTEDFINFYNNIDTLIQRKFQGFTMKKDFDNEWFKLTKIETGVIDEAPDEIKALAEDYKYMSTFMTDPGIINRFRADDIVSENLSIEKITLILQLLSCSRKESDFLYYTSTKPGNPLYDFPLINIGDGVYQVFEVKQIIHAIDNLLENICSEPQAALDRLVSRKGNHLEQKIISLFNILYNGDFKYYHSYYIDGCEQDILLLWKNYAIIIEAKGYNLREPFRDPDKAFVRIKDDFNSTIGYGYTQTKRVEQKFAQKQPLLIQDKNGNTIEEIDTSMYEDFSIIVNLKSFGQIQNDLSVLLEIGEDDVYPWAVKLDDLEIFILTLIAQKRKNVTFIDFLTLRENLHGKLICSDECEVIGGFLTNKLNSKIVDRHDVISTRPDLADIFDKQYRKGMGFENEKLIKEKTSGKYIFW